MSQSKPVSMPTHLWEALEQMSTEMGVDTDGLVSQAVYTLARLNGYVVPGKAGGGAGGFQGSSPSRHPPAAKPAKAAPPSRRAMPEPEPEPEPMPAADGPDDFGGLPQEPSGDFGGEDLGDAGRSVGGRAGLTLIVAGRDPYKMTGESFTIGRGKTCDFVIESNRVSREHCRIAKEGADYVLEDLNSSNGTFFGPNKEKITRRKIKDGDEFTLGTEKIKFQIRK